MAARPQMFVSTTSSTSSSRSVSPSPPNSSFLGAPPSRQSSLSSSSTRHLSQPPSLSSIRPTPTRPSSNNKDKGKHVESETKTVAVGLLTEEELGKVLKPWRMKLRRGLARSLEREMPYLVWIQDKCRTPARDVYFVKTSLLGSHGFFMLFIPSMVWFSNGHIGRSLLYILATGGYTTSLLKDLFCIARPYSPPIIRLTIGTHHHEYGFPSTHSTNAVSMALYFGSIVWRYSNFGGKVDGGVYVLLGVFAGSVTFGRLYTGMHSMMDVSVGITLGVLCWAGYALLDDSIERYTTQGQSILTSLMTTTFILSLINFHPAPAEDCPCFEDAVAFLGVVLGIMVGRTWDGRDWESGTVGASWGSSNEVMIWVGATLLKLFIGTMSILVWRILAKEICHRTLPPIFRFFSDFLLPRRHYLNATEYDRYKKTDSLHPIPSILDLPSLEELDPPVSEIMDGTVPPEGELGFELRKRPIRGGEVQNGHQKKEKGGPSASVGGKGRDEERKDADVLTKVIVYAGIGWIATIGVPMLFVRIGLSVALPSTLLPS